MFTLSTDGRHPTVTLSYYPSFEAREAAFNESVGRLVPSMLAGPERFWSDLSAIVHRRLDADPDARGAFITSNPRDCLAFGTAHQVLTAACLRAGIAPDAIAAAAAEVAAEFSLRTNRHQPLRTLSGGESVKLAMAKAAIAAENSTRLSVASPFSWLSASNAGLMGRLLGRYAGRRLPVSVFALEEEDVMAPDPAVGDPVGAYPPVAFGIRLSAVSVALSSSVAITAGAPPPRAFFTDAAFTLPSPCLLMGDNGQGKSLLAKLLTGVMTGRGRIGVDGACGGRRPRMIFQDVVAQTLSRTPAGMLDGLADEARAATLVRYRELAKALRAAPVGPGHQISDTLPAAPSLLEIKLVLAAQRLAADTALIILDEPDWGLSRRAAAAFVAAVVGAAHRRAIPVLIISHKPWWEPFARSRLVATKTLLGVDTEDNRDGFLIRLAAEA